MYFNHLLRMKSYLVTIETDHHYKLVSKCARGINEQLQKTSGPDVLSSRKKPGGWGVVPPCKTDG